MTQGEVFTCLSYFIDPKYYISISICNCCSSKSFLLLLGEERKPKFYVDFSNKQIDQKGFDAAEELREKKIPENLEPGNTFNYEVDWSALVGSK